MKTSSKILIIVFMLIANISAHARWWINEVDNQIYSDICRSGSNIHVVYPQPIGTPCSWMLSNGSMVWGFQSKE